MKKYYGFIVIGQFVLMTLFFAYALAQRFAAIDATQRARQAQEIAQENEMRAVAAQQEALRQNQLAQQHLAAAVKAAEDCAKRK